MVSIECVQGGNAIAFVYFSYELSSLLPTFYDFMTLVHVIGDWDVL